MPCADAAHGPSLPKKTSQKTSQVLETCEVFAFHSYRAASSAGKGSSPRLLRCQ
jgi:hypothetical protein